MTLVELNLKSATHPIHPLRSRVLSKRKAQDQIKNQLYFVHKLVFDVLIQAFSQFFIVQTQNSKNGGWKRQNKKLSDSRRFTLLESTETDKIEQISKFNFMC